MSALVTDSVTRQARVRRTFHVVAVAEAVSWGALLVAMFFKWIVQDDPHSGIEGGVPVAGALHGAIFVAYVVTALVAWRILKWPARTAILALLAAVPPFCSLIAERRVR